MDLGGEGTSVGMDRRATNLAEPDPEIVMEDVLDAIQFHLADVVQSASGFTSAVQDVLALSQLFFHLRHGVGDVGQKVGRS